MSKNAFWILTAVAVLGLASLACLGTGDVPDVEPTEEPPTAAPTDAPATAVPTEPPVVEPTATLAPVPKPEQASLALTNQSETELWYVYISPAKAEDWGEDWLGDEVILAGQTHTIGGIPEGLYDVRIEDKDGVAVEERWEVTLEGETAWRISGMASLEVANEADETIAYLYISPVESDSWGENWLGDVVVAAGDQYAVEGIPRGPYDIQVADASDETIESVFNVELSGMSTWSVTGKTDLPASAELRFDDDFSDNRNDWGFDTEDENAFFMRPSGGEYCILIKSDQWTAWEWYEPFRPEEFVAEVACRLEGLTDASCGLGFGPDEDNLYWLEISPFDQTYALFLLEDGTWQDRLIDWTESKNIDPDGANFLSMERVGGVLSVFANGVLIGEVDGSRFPSGRIGIGGSTYEDGNVTVCLDNLRVWRME
jgi:hypothetical protein